MFLLDRKTNNHVKNYDMTRRRLSLEADQEKSHWSVRQREANRRIVDTRNNLESIYQRQRAINEVAAIAEQEKRTNEIEKKIEDITSRRTQIQSQIQSARVEQKDEHESLFKAKAAHRLTELKAREHEDHLKHFQKLVQKDDDLEQDLYKTVKEAEFLRRKRESELKKLQEQFIELKKQNAAQIKEIIAKAAAEEQEFQQKLLREKAKVDRVSVHVDSLSVLST